MSHDPVRQGFGLLIIGDEIIRGKREDRHFAKVVEILAARGLVLDWALYAGDDRDRLTGMLRSSFAASDIVFSCGGIGNTPDDHTRQACAAALGTPLELHPEAEQLIRQRFAEAKREVTEASLGMACFPCGARIIPNPVNRIAGFSVHHHHFVPGFPQMAWPMIEWVLDTYYSHCFDQDVGIEESILVWDGIESVLTPLMRRIETEYPGVKVFSLPSLGTAEIRRHIELGVRGKPANVPAAMAEIRREVVGIGYSFDETGNK